MDHNLCTCGHSLSISSPLVPVFARLVSESVVKYVLFIVFAPFDVCCVNEEDPVNRPGRPTNTGDTPGFPRPQTCLFTRLNLIPPPTPCAEL